MKKEEGVIQTSTGGSVPVSVTGLPSEAICVWLAYAISIRFILKIHMLQGWYYFAKFLPLYVHIGHLFTR